MSIFTDFSHQYGQGTNVGVDLSGHTTGIHQDTVVGHIPGMDTIHSGPHIISHVSDGLGGTHTLYDGKFAHTNRSNPFGGENVYDHNGHLLRTSVGSHIGTDHQVSAIDDGSVAQQMIAPVDFGNATQILGYADPLAHSGSYHMPPFDPNQFSK